MPASEYPSVLRRTAVVVLIGVLLTLIGIIGGELRDAQRARESLANCRAMMDSARTLVDSGQVLLRHPHGPSYDSRTCVDYLTP